MGDTLPFTDQSEEMMSWKHSFYVVMKPGKTQMRTLIRTSTHTLRVSPSTLLFSPSPSLQPEPTELSNKTDVTNAHSVLCAITGRCWGCRWPPGGSTRAGRLSAGCCWSLSDALWWKESSSSRRRRFRRHAASGWTRSSLPGPAGAAGSSPWNGNHVVNLDYLIYTWNKKYIHKILNQAVQELHIINVNAHVAPF